MKHKTKNLEIKFGEPESFTLVVEQAVDGDRIQAATAKQIKDRQEAEKQQIPLLQ